MIHAAEKSLAFVKEYKKHEKAADVLYNSGIFYLGLSTPFRWRSARPNSLCNVTRGGKEKVRISKTRKLHSVRYFMIVRLSYTSAKSVPV